jgi:hypothetical protein
LLPLACKSADCRRVAVRDYFAPFYSTFLRNGDNIL